VPCEKVDLGGGSMAIVCSRGRRARSCSYCSSTSSRLCDYPVKEHKSGMCDRPLCERCTTRIAGDGDLCRAHAPLWKEQTATT
jgi:hypothetical protein